MNAIDEMLSQTETLVASEIITFANRGGRRRLEWYAGIASDPRARLFVDHQVSESTDAWIYRDAGTEHSARKIERFLLDRHGFDGGEGGGGYSTKYVYAYRKNSHTNP